MGFLSKIFGSKPQAPRETTDKVATMRHEGQRPVTQGFDDVIGGYQFSATLNPRTPLWILEKHGETHPGPESKLPQYGEDRHGIWTVETKSWEELGIPGMKELEGAMMASAVGHIPKDGGEFLPFLKEFRRIAEGASEIEEKVDQVRILVAGNPVYREYGQSLMFGDIGRLLQSLGWEVCCVPFSSETLFKAGYRSLDDLRNANDEELLAIGGLGPKKLVKIRQALSQA